MAVNIISKSRELTEVEIYLMTVSPAITVLKDVEDGTVIPVSAVLTFEDHKDTGETTELLTVLTPDKKAYSCQSATFKRALTDIMSIMGDKPFSIIKRSGVTKAGRDFISCELDVTSVE